MKRYVTQKRHINPARRVRSKPLLLRLWFKALGERASDCDFESDSVAWIRTAIFCTYFLTNLFICAGVVRHWNN